MVKSTTLAMCLACWATCLTAAEPPLRDIRFSRDVLPILSKHCLHCHGFDAAARQAELRLDTYQGATDNRDGRAAIVPGQPEHSELMRRITASAADTVMPPPEQQERLSQREIDTLRDWIASGAEYETHWAFAPLRKSTPPRVTEITHPIDAFVAHKLREHGRHFAPETSPERWLRRVTFDLTGIPPSLAELESFQADLARSSTNSEACYERVVERLLASPRLGEHLAVAWLDAARYADSHGYFSDKPRQMWLWRDWVIKAFNANLPFDQFTIEQLAGDLLPSPSVDQLVATGFNRNHMANNETGIIDEEFRVEYVVDRVHTTMTTWLGLTAGCAQCHDHKFDPISQRDYYQLFAFFNNVPEKGLITADDPPPVISVPSEEQSQRLRVLAEEARAAQEAYEPVRKQLLEIVNTASFEPRSQPALPADTSALIFAENFTDPMQSDARTIGPGLLLETGVLGTAAAFDGTQHVEADLEQFDPDGAWTIGFWLQTSGALGCPLSKVEPLNDRRGIEVLLSKGSLKIQLIHRWAVDSIEVATPQVISSGKWHHVVMGYDGSRSARGLQVFVDGRPVELKVERDTLTGTTRNTQPLRLGRRDSGLGFYGRIDEVRVMQELVAEQDIQDWYWNERLRSLMATPVAQRSAADSEQLVDYYFSAAGQQNLVTTAALPIELSRAQALRAHARQTQQAERQLRAAIPTALVLQEMDPPRTTHILHRGSYDQPGEAVLPGTPAIIAPWPDQAPRNRLGLAQWLVSPQNPLTARVAVNRLWQLCFSAGLVRTPDDFGMQGEPPTHPELLDWLAATFRDEGWDVKRMLRLIVTSQTYRQESRQPWLDHQPFDPENRWLARGPSSRLSAEMLRDQALALSGLLVSTMGGPSVNSYQPAGLWESVSYNAEEVYLADAAEGLWRRSLYSTIKRQLPPPWLLVFDGPTREKCTLKRPVTNTPLQALVLLNDITYVEAARLLAAKILAQTDGDAARLRLLWRTVLLREPLPAEFEALQNLLLRQRTHFIAHPEKAGELSSVGTAPYASQMAPPELAAWTVVAHTVCSLDEALTKR